MTRKLPAWRHLEYRPCPACGLRRLYEDDTQCVLCRNPLCVYCERLPRDGEDIAAGEITINGETLFWRKDVERWATIPETQP